MITLKMVDQGRSDFCVVFTMSHCALELKRMLISLPFEVIRLLIKLDKQTLKGCLKLTCEYEFHILPNTKVSATEDHGKNYKKVRPTSGLPSLA